MSLSHGIARRCVLTGAALVVAVLLLAGSSPLAAWSAPAGTNLLPGLLGSRPAAGGSSSNPVGGLLGGLLGGHPSAGSATAGYWLAGSQGGVGAYGGTGFHGSMAGRPLAAPVVAMAATPHGNGYWLAAADGGIFTFGTAPFRGSAAGAVPPGERVVAMAEGAGTGTGQRAAGDFTPAALAATGGSPYAAASGGYDISWPQCGGAYPPASPVAVVGVNAGEAFSVNPCYDQEAAWAGLHRTDYVNLNAPQGSVASEWERGPGGACAVGDLTCESYNYGYNTTADSIAAAAYDGYPSSVWWLDVETANYWTSDLAANDQVIAGALRAIADAGDHAAIYSTSYQWSQIAGSYDPGVPAWYPTGSTSTDYGGWCSSTSFAGGPVFLVQHPQGRYDGDYAC